MKLLTAGLTFDLLRFPFYVLPLPFSILPFTFYLLGFTFCLLPLTFTLFDVHGSWLMAGKSLVSIAALLVEILDMREGGEEEEGVQVITLVALNLWVLEFSQLA